MNNEILKELHNHHILNNINVDDYEKFISDASNHQYLCARIDKRAEELVEECREKYENADDDTVMKYLNAKFYNTAVLYSKISKKSKLPNDKLLRQVASFEDENEKVISNYGNISGIYDCCLGCMSLFKKQGYIDAVLGLMGDPLSRNHTFLNVLRIKNDTCLSDISIENPETESEIDRIIDYDSNLDKTTLSEVFRRELIKSVAIYKHFGLDIRSYIRPVSDKEAREIVNMAFMDFNSLRCVELFPFDQLSITQIVSNCINNYLAVCSAKCRKKDKVDTSKMS